MKNKLLVNEPTVVLECAKYTQWNAFFQNRTASCKIN